MGSDYKAMVSTPAVAPLVAEYLMVHTYRASWAIPGGPRRAITGRHSGPTQGTRGHKAPEASEDIVHCT